VARPSEDATEEPTPRRLDQARRRGEVAVSRALTSSAGFLAVTVVLAWEAPALVARAVATLRAALAAALAGAGPASGAQVASALGLRLCGPSLVAIVLVSLGVGLAQTRGLVLAPVRLDLGRLAAGASLRRVFDGQAARAAGKGLLEVALVAAVAVVTLRPVVPALAALTGAPAGRLLATLGALAGRLAVRLAGAGLALGALDALLVARRHRRGLRMTREEVKREHREAEGDPAHRGERARLHREILEQRMVEEVRKADFVVVNPEHIAVALRYDAEGDAAPVVVARGERLVAERIKQIAREAGVPIFRDVALARALAELGEGGEIPPELYEAVAEIVRVVLAAGNEEPRPGAAPVAPPAASPKPGAVWRRV
jgi:flagellar biosynthesis protein FlhB